MRSLPSSCTRAPKRAPGNGSTRNGAALSAWPVRAVLMGGAFLVGS
jgi:hypothetical protein